MLGRIAAENFSLINFTPPPSFFSLWSVERGKSGSTPAGHSSTGRVRMPKFRGLESEVFCLFVFSREAPGIVIFRLRL